MKQILIIFLIICFASFLLAEEKEGKKKSKNSYEDDIQISLRTQEIVYAGKNLKEYRDFAYLGIAFNAGGIVLTSLGFSMKNEDGKANESMVLIGISSMAFGHC